MPNIMLTYRCNLRCPYCFANEFVNRTDCDMTEENFRRAVSFAASRPKTTIGWIGGEPTIHPRLPDFLRILAENPNVETAMVYSNGLQLEPLLKVMAKAGVGSIVRVLVNCNSPRVMGERNFERLKESLDLAFGTYHVGQQIKFGLNLYDNDFDYSFIRELLLRYDQHQLRISLTVPDFTCVHLSRVEIFCRETAPTDVALFEVSLPDEDGYMSCGASGVALHDCIRENAKKILVQVNPNVPYVFGEHNRIHVSCAPAGARSEAFPPFCMQKPRNQKVPGLLRFVPRRLAAGEMCKLTFLFIWIMIVKTNRKERILCLYSAIVFTHLPIP